VFRGSGNSLQCDLVVVVVDDLDDDDVCMFVCRQKCVVGAVQQYSVPCNHAQPLQKKNVSVRL
jgi:hypothetical protein